MGAGRVQRGALEGGCRVRNFAGWEFHFCKSIEVNLQNSRICVRGRRRRGDERGRIFAGPPEGVDGGLFRGGSVGVEVPAGRVRALTPTVRGRGGSR